MVFIPLKYCVGAIGLSSGILKSLIFQFERRYTDQKLNQPEREPR